MSDNNQDSYRWPRRNGNSNGETLQRVLNAMQTVFMPAVLGWCIWATDSIYKIQAQTSAFSQYDARIDRLNDRLHDLELRFARYGLRAGKITE